ncbi:tyrosine-type recombinase/integrase [Maribacter litoralis]|uniref:Site-specific recombinase XerD n=1 Tax=Maribacter litoralis TaxID=2059726 RepID=A0A653TNB4_9FLAO|nr:tyrosine-type recombinase/integrase [Maribacter litoralis]VXB81977.1 Site-specific recombinase XerD [Maribacter litoralis]
MKNSFYLRKSKSKTETLILFSCYFNQEKKKFVYSTQKSILPQHWDFENRKPYRSGKFVCRNQPAISKRLRDFEDAFHLIKSRSELGELEFDSNTLKEHFDRVFERVSKASSFFEVYDRFTEEKIKLKEWKKSTVKRYANIKNLLTEFEEVYNYKLTFGKINKKFFTEFTDFCYEYKNHYTNTFSRNVGLFKTFMIWSLKNGYAYNDSFKSFKKPQRVLTREEVLSLEQILEISNTTFETEHLEKVKDVFVFQCLTGMRYGELKFINKRLITRSNCILLKEEKNSNKVPRLIPMSKLALAILKKYDYRLPLISNQKQNAAVKEVVGKIGLSHDVEFSRTKGVVQEIFIKPFNKRIGTHTARRSFITIMRNKGIADKTIMSISGHTDIKSFNQYHQVDNSARISAVNSVFDNL